MPSNPLLRFRRSAAQLHALAQVERTIRSTDTTCRRKYLRDFSEAFQTYRKILGSSELEQRFANAELVLVGDYHALPASQRFTAEVVESLVKNGKQVLLAVEAIVARDQHILDEWQRHEIDSGELRSRIRFETDWGYDWQPFRELLDRARGCGVRVFGLDCVPRQDMRSIRARDRHAAAKIAELRESDPNATVVVLFGESHLAPNHLPMLLHELRPQDDMLTVLQNIDALYWQSAGEPQDLVEAVEVANDVVCVFSATPLEKYEYYRLCIERWKQMRAGRRDLAPCFYNLIGSLLRFLNIDPYAVRAGASQAVIVDQLPEVWSVSNDEQLERLLMRRMSTRTTEVRRALAENGSHFVAERNVIVAHEFRMPWAAEQASRFVHHACRGGKKHFVAEDDAFYASVIETAMAFFGSKILCPSRKLYETEQIAAEFRRSDAELEQAGLIRFSQHAVLNWVMVHRKPPKNRKLRSAADFDKYQLKLASEILGGLLGSGLYKAYLHGRVSKRMLRSVLFKDLAKPGLARSLYFKLANLVEKTKVEPSRMVS